MKRIKVLLFISMIFYSTVTYSQGIIVDDFSQKALPGWIWGGVEMKYSHNEDNKENGFADIYSKNQINSGEYIGKIVLKRNYLFTAGNYINIMLKGVKNDATVIIKLLYDIDNDKMLNNDKDMILSSNPVSLNFEGWKEIKLKIDQDNFKINSSNYDNFEVTEENVYGIQLDFEAGNQYAKSVFESGIALISEIPNKEALSFDESGSSSNKESYFNATNTPNPFNPATKITYTLPQSTYVTLSVYDRLGRQVEVLIDQNQESGEHSAEFNASNLPSGIYFYRIKTPEKTEVRKMIFAK
jgi:hypothetical protein